MNRPAGQFGPWLQQMQQVLRGERQADVPCDGCVGCCVSGYPVPLRPHDQVALERVPANHLSLPLDGRLARMLPREDGTCPMFADGGCSIYADRPQTCRDYDCRIYAAAGLEPDGERPVIRQRVREWRFGFDDEADQARVRAVRRAAAFIRGHAASFPPRLRAHSAAAASVLAVKVHGLFMQPDDTTPPAQQVAQVLAAAEAFDAGVAASFDAGAAPPADRTLQDPR